MTPNREDYLKLLLELGGEKKEISNKFLAQGLHVSAASVSEMIGKLTSEELVTHTAYKGVRLTKKGVLQATRLVRKHRLWEVFLMNNLHFSWEEVHQDAEILEHATSEKLEDALANFLGNPEYCPHGGVIPKANTPIVEKQATPLLSVEADKSIRILRVIDEKSLLIQLSEKDIQINEVYNISKKTKDEIFLQNEQKAITISSLDAALIFVEEI